MVYGSYGADLDDSLVESPVRHGLEILRGLKTQMWFLSKIKTMGP